MDSLNIPAPVHYPPWLNASSTNNVAERSYEHLARQPEARTSVTFLQQNFRMILRAFLQGRLSAQTASFMSNLIQEQQPVVRELPTNREAMSNCTLENGHVQRGLFWGSRLATGSTAGHDYAHHFMTTPFGRRLGQLRTGIDTPDEQTFTGLVISPMPNRHALWGVFSGPKSDALVGKLALNVGEDKGISGQALWFRPNGEINTDEHQPDFSRFSSFIGHV